MNFTFDFDSSFAGFVATYQTDLEIQLLLTDSFVGPVAAIVDAVAHRCLVDALAAGALKVFLFASDRVHFAFVVVPADRLGHIARNAPVTVTEDAF